MNIVKKSLVVGLSILALASVARAPEQKDIVDTAVGAGSFPTLVSLVQRAGLVETLKGDGPFTVLAPTEAAFKKVPKSTLDILLKDNKALTAVLTYHVIPGKAMAADVVKLNNKTVKTVQGENVRVRVRNGKVRIQNANVVKTDIGASNGVIHVIDSVIVPPTILRALSRKSH